MNLTDKYKNALASIPPSGGGGCHTALLGVANLGIMIGATHQQIFLDIRQSIPQGGRTVPDREIVDAIKRASRDVIPVGEGGCYRPLPIPPKPRPLVKPEYLQQLIKRGSDIVEADLWEASTVRPYDETDKDAVLLLDTLYRCDDILFLGERYDTKVQSAAKWIDQIRRSGTNGLPHIIPNPVTGEEHISKSGKASFRCDAAIKDFRFAMVEFDDLSRQDQLAFWASIPLPIAALIDSGGKSIHGWIATEGITNSEQWTAQVEIGLYKQRLIPMGVDPACRNEARLSRLAGHLRQEKSRWQRLLYLNPNPICSPIIE